MHRTLVRSRTIRPSFLLPALLGVGALQLGCSERDVPDSIPGVAGNASGGTSAKSGTGTSGAATGGNGVGGSTTNGLGGSSVSATSGCYSPSQNLSMANVTGAKGCACKPGIDVDVCVQSVALVCRGGFWIVADDGPCMQIPPKTYSPTACTAAGGIPVASPGSPITAEKDCASGVALGIIDLASSGWDEGGLCCAPQTTAKACGARAGNTCSTKEYCAYVEGEFCGQADAEATCKLRPNGCDDIYQPVCGCDGKTYGNSCAAASAGTGVYSDGTCT